MTISQKLRSVLSIGCLILLTAVSGFAQTGTIMPNPKFTGVDNNGLIIASGRLCTYAAGTTTPQPTYSDVNLSVANTNPVVLDAAGRATVFLSSTSYKFVLRAAGGALTGNTAIDCAATTQLWSQDNISAVPTTSAGVDITNQTAGEAITAGQAVYLSAGDAGKNAGQWYKADSANTYSSTVNWVGLAVNNIAAAGTGTIRIAGSVTGLSSLAVGSSYYVGTAGALTSTMPVNARKLGEADTPTSLVLTSNPPPVTASGPFADDFRLSLTTATCVTASDVTAATTLYLTPCTGNRISLFSSSGAVETCTTAEVSIAIPATTSQMYDVWAYDSTFGSCTVTLELLAWTSDTARATATVRTSGVWVKSGDTTRRYLGSVRTTTVSGQTEDSVTKRYVWNAYNRVRKHLQRLETTATWTYSTATWRQANGATANQVDVIVGLQEVTLDLTLAAAATANGNQTFMVNIGEDSTTTPIPAIGGAIAYLNAGSSATLISHVDKMPAIGRHFYAWLEISQNAWVTTWSSNNAIDATKVSGLFGWIEG